VIMLIPVPVLVLGLLARVGLAATGQLVFQTAVGVVAAGLNLALDFALIPRYDAVGAAVANSIAQLASSVPVFIYVHRLLGQDDWRLLSLSKAGLSAAAGGLVAWLCVLLLGGIAGVVVGFVAGGVAFLALAGAVGMLSADDAQWLDGAVGGAFGGRVGRMVRFCGQPTPSRTL
jgi:O-antigen/teichoic acid export membrane protein